ANTIFIDSLDLRKIQYNIALTRGVTQHKFPFQKVSGLGINQIAQRLHNHITFMFFNSITHSSLVNISQIIKGGLHIDLHPLRNITMVGIYELFSSNMLRQLYTSFGYGFYAFIGHRRHLLPVFTLETILHQPLAYKLLGQLLLRLSILLALLVSICIEVAR